MARADHRVGRLGLRSVREPDLRTHQGPHAGGRRRHSGVRLARAGGDPLFAIFLLGSTIGGLAAGSLADRYGRRPLLIATILLYSLFSGLTYFATELWHIAVLRFLVAMGVGGEWAVAASLVAEVFPTRARAYASGIFHASSVLGIWMATLAGIAVGQNWRYAYLIGIFPALLILWVRARVREPEKWQATAAEANQSPSDGARMGSFWDLLTTSPWDRRALLGMALAAVGLGTFWAVVVAGPELAKQMLARTGVADASLVDAVCLRIRANDRWRTRVVGVWTDQCAFWPAANVHRLSIAGAGDRADYVFCAANVLAAAPPAADLRISDDGHSRRLRDLFSGVVSDASCERPAPASASTAAASLRFRCCCFPVGSRRSRASTCGGP